MPLYDVHIEADTIMEKNMETAELENEMEKNMKDETEGRVIKCNKDIGNVESSHAGTASIHCQGAPCNGTRRRALG